MKDEFLKNMDPTKGFKWNNHFQNALFFTLKNCTSCHKNKFIPKLAEPLVTECLSTKYVFSIVKNILRVNSMLTVQELSLVLLRVGIAVPPGLAQFPTYMIILLYTVDGMKWCPISLSIQSCPGRLKSRSLCNMCELVISRPSKYWHNFLVLNFQVFPKYKCRC